MYHDTVQLMEIKSYKQRREELRATVISEMQALLDQGLTMQKVGDLYGVTRAEVNNLIKGHNLAKRPS